MAGFGQRLIGDVDWQILGSLPVGSIPGIMISSLMADVVPERIVRPLVGVVLVGVGLRMVLR